MMEYRAGSRGFPVEYAALGFLVEKPMHGYELRARIEEGLGPLWRIASSQLYQVIRRLEKQGLVRRTSRATSAGPSRAVVHATEQGAAEFWAWAEAPVSSMRDVRVEFAAKLYFARRLRPRTVSVLIDRQISALDPMQHHVHSQNHGDDAALQAAWQMLQQSTIENFASWLHAHRDVLQHPKEGLS